MYKVEISNFDLKSFLVDANTKEEAIEQAISMFFDDENYFESLHITATLASEEDLEETFEEETE